MINGLFQKTLHNDIAFGLKALSAKNTIIAENLANKDTPGYKAKKLEFHEVMNNYYGGNKSISSVAGRIGGLPKSVDSLLVSSAGASSAAENRRITIDRDYGLSGRGFTRFQNNMSLRNDYNDVNTDYEMAEQAGAAIMYSMLTEVAGSRFATLKEIIRTR